MELDTVTNVYNPMRPTMLLKECLGLEKKKKERDKSLKEYLFLND